MNLPGVYPMFNEMWKDYQSCYIISDTHFDDPDLIHAYADRPNAEQQVKLINSKVGKMDVLIHLGDVGNVDYVRQLKGAMKILICGNHDAGASNYQRQIVKKKFPDSLFTKQQALDEMKRLYPNCVYSIELHYDFHSPFTYWEVKADNKLFDLIFTGPLMLGEKLLLSHEPINMIPWAFNIHGHVHDRRVKNNGNHFNVCADVIGYEPINFNQWMKQGHMANIISIHRETIDNATARAKKRGYRLGRKPQ